MLSPTAALIPLAVLLAVLLAACQPAAEQPERETEWVGPSHTGKRAVEAH